jgi:hypothetical protein
LFQGEAQRTRQILDADETRMVAFLFCHQTALEVRAAKWLGACC